MSSLKLRRALHPAFSPLKQPLVAPVLLAAALAACSQQTDAPKEAAQAPAAPAPAPVAPQGAVEQMPVASAAPAASTASAAEGAEDAEDAYEFPPLTPEGEAVKQRAQERWDALVARDFERAWSYLEAAKREKIEQGNYKNHFGNAGSWVQATVLNAKCITGRCAAFVRLTTRTAAPGMAAGRGTLDVINHFNEEWVLEDGQWNYRGLRNGLPKNGEEALPSAAAPHRPRPQEVDPSKGSFGGGGKRK